MSFHNSSASHTNHVTFTWSILHFKLKEYNTTGNLVLSLTSYRMASTLLSSFHAAMLSFPHGQTAPTFGSYFWWSIFKEYLHGNLHGSLLSFLLIITQMLPCKRCLLLWIYTICLYSVFHSTCMLFLSSFFPISVNVLWELELWPYFKKIKSSTPACRLLLYTLFVFCIIWIN